MKNIRFIVGIIVLVCTLFQFSYQQQAQAAEPSVSKVEPNVAKSPAGPNDLAPQIKIETAIYDFGQVGIGTKNTCEFKFTNTGKGTLKIKTVKSTCGCTVPALAKREYTPGQSGTVDVTFTAPGGPGDVVKHIYIESNDPQNPNAELVIKAHIVEIVKYEPEVLKLSLKQSNAGCPPIKLASTDGKAFSVKSFKSTADCLSLDFDPNASAAQFVLQPKVNIDRLEKVLNGSVTIALTHPQCKQVDILFEAVSVFSINPPMIMILKAKPSAPVTREVWVINNYKEPFEIESVSSQKGMVKLLSKEKQDNGYKLMLEITPPVPQAKIKIFSDTVVVTVKGGTKLEINCRGFFEGNLTKSSG